MYAFERGPQDAPPADAELMGKTRIEVHYAQAGYFLRENQLLEEAHRIPRVPIHLVHGQRDLTCAPEASWALHRALPGSTLEILRTAGHLSGEAPMQDALLRAAEAMVPRLSPARP
jgi:proline iminopeptidase